MSDIWIWIALGCGGLLLLGIVLIYNILIGKRQLTRSGWADIDVQLQRRADLIPKLVDVVSAFAVHEKTTFQETAAARAAVESAGDDVARREQAEVRLGRDAQRLWALAENYPELTASKSYQELHDQLSHTEEIIARARRFYNGAVRDYNTAVEQFPASLIAKIGGMSAAPYFNISPEDAALPVVMFEG